MKNTDYAGLEHRLTQAISRKPVPVRYFVHDIDGDSADAVECTESQFMEAAGLISYERHTVYANGVDQICLTKMPTL